MTLRTVQPSSGKIGLRWAMAALILCLWTAGAAYGADYTIDRDETVFAVVIHKAGIASAMAHNHLVTAPEYTYELSADSGAESLQFRMEVQTESLRVDAPNDQKRWFPMIKQLGILDTAFTSLGEDTRGDIRGSMLGEDQLHAGEFPVIKAEVKGISQDGDGQDTEGGIGNDSIRLAFTVHGKTVEREIPGQISIEDGALRVNAAGSFRFSEFGIEPYSAFFGSVRNQDRFHVVARVVAEKAAQEADAEASGGASEPGSEED